MASNPDSQPELVIASRRIYEGRIARLREDTVRLPDGRTAQREIVEHDEVVATVPLDGDGNVILVKQYRLATGSFLLEVPAGLVDAGESPEAAAQRELQEEAGYRAERLRRLCGFYVSPGFCTEFVHVFLATGLIESRLDADEDEDLVVVRIPLAEAVALVRSGGIVDAKSIVGLLMAGAPPPPGRSER